MRNRKTLFVPLCILICFSILLGWGLKRSFAPGLSAVTPDPSNRMMGELSPDGRYRMDFYLTGGVLWKGGDYSYIGRLSDSNGTFIKNVVWLPSDYSFQWVDGRTVEVEGRSIHVMKETYDFRWKPSVKEDD